MQIEHKVNQGECVSSIAFTYGFFPDTIWNDPANAQLKQLRKNPNVLCAGDTVMIPDKRLKTELRVTEAKHRFKRKGVPEVLRIVVLDAQGNPRQFAPFVLTLDGIIHKGKTDAKGALKVPIPPNACGGDLVVGEGARQQVMRVNLGNLDPITEITGVKQRLTNLGYACGVIDSSEGAELKSALEQFQTDNGLQPTGEPDQQTRKSLENCHGS